MEKTVLNITINENDRISVDMPDCTLAISTMVDILQQDIANGKNDTLKMLLATTVGLLSSDPTDNFLKQYIKDLQSALKNFRNVELSVSEDDKTMLS